MRREQKFRDHKSDPTSARSRTRKPFLVIVFSTLPVVGRALMIFLVARDCHGDGNNQHAATKITHGVTKAK